MLSGTLSVIESDENRDNGIKEINQENFHGLALIHWPYIPSYGDETSVFYQKQDFYELESDLLEIIKQPENEEALKKFKKNCDYCVYRAKTGEAKRDQSLGNVDGEMMPRFYGLRLSARLKHILGSLEKLEKGQNIWEICKPYVAIRNGMGIELKDQKLFLEQEKLFYGQLVLDAIAAFESWLDGKSIQSSQWTRSLMFIMNLNPTPEQFSPLFVKLIKNTNFCYYFFNDHQNLSQTGDWQKITKCFLGSKDAISCLQRFNQLNDFFSVLEKQENVGDFFLNHLTILEDLISVTGMGDFFSLIKNMTLNNKNEKFIKAGLDRRDYFKALLLQGFRYEDCIQSAKEHFNSYANEFSLFFYEAFVRGDLVMLRMLSDLSSKQEITKTEFKKKGIVTNQSANFFKTNETEKTTKEYTSYKNAVTYSLSGLIIYMQQKYICTDNKQDLFFISSLGSFIDELIKYNIITEADIETVREQIENLYPKENNHLDVVISENNQALLFRLEVLEKENKVLQKNNASLKRGSDDLAKHVALLERKVTEIEERVDQLKQLGILMDVKPYKV